MAKASLTETRRTRYEDDLYAWSQEQIALLRARRADCLDWDTCRMQAFEMPGGGEIEVPRLIALRLKP